MQILLYLEQRKFNEPNLFRAKNDQPTVFRAKKGKENLMNKTYSGQRKLDT